MVFFLAAVIALAEPQAAAAKPKPELRRLDTIALTQGDGPIVVSVRSTSLPLRESSESLDRFSARIVPADATTAVWQPCTTAAGAFCSYTPNGNGVRKLRFERVDAAGELQIRYSYPDSPDSNVIRIPIQPQPATNTLQAIGRAFGAPPTSEPPGTSLADALHVELAVAAPPPSRFEDVRVSCASTPLYADTKRTPLRAGAAALRARDGQVFTVERRHYGALRALDFGARIYLDAACVKPV